MVTTNTAQDITAAKTFSGAKLVNFKLGSNEANPAGFTCYDYSGAERANLQFGTRTVGGRDDYYLTLGNHSSNASKVKVGFRLQDSASNSYNFIMPTGTSLNFVGAGYTTTTNNFIPCAFKNGSTVVNANSYGLVDLSSLMPTVPTVVDTVADGNMNAVTSNAVYDIVGDIETLLASI